MCGIFGIVTHGPSENLSENQIKSVFEGLSARGPDDKKYYSDQNMEFLFTRLSIIDTEMGMQPHFDTDKDNITIANGEIYNHREIREKLLKNNRSFRTKSDIEVIPHLINDYKDSMEWLEIIEGQFAIANWNKKNKKLILARDRFGKKPLFYSIIDNSKLIFSSDFITLLKILPNKMSIDNEALNYYLNFNYIPAPYSIDTRVRKLGAGEYLIFNGGKIIRKKYYDINQVARRSMGNSVKNIKEAYELFKIHFENSVQKRLLMDVKYSLFLSGGLDSASIYGAIMNISGLAPSSFTIKFEDAKYDESEMAFNITEKFQGEQKIIKIGGNDIIDNFKTHVYSIGEPFGDFSTIPMYILSKNSYENGYKVSFSGDGGDEIFGGYDRYQTSFTLNRNLKSYINALKINNENMGDKVESKFKIFETKDMVNNYMLYDFKTILEGNILIKSDRMGMASSVEIRSPFLDRDLVNFGINTSSSFKISNGLNKILIRKYLEEMGLNFVLDKNKRQFTVPFDDILRDSKISNKLLNNLKFLEKMDKNYHNIVSEYMSGNNKYFRNVRNIFALELWYDIISNEITI